MLVTPSRQSPLPSLEGPLQSHAPFLCSTPTPQLLLPCHLQGPSQTLAHPRAFLEPQKARVLWVTESRVRIQLGLGWELIHLGHFPCAAGPYSPELGLSHWSAGEAASPHQEREDSLQAHLSSCSLLSWPQHPSPTKASPYVFLILSTSEMWVVV